MILLRESRKRARHRGLILSYAPCSTPTLLSWTLSALCPWGKSFSESVQSPAGAGAGARGARQAWILL